MNDENNAVEASRSNELLGCPLPERETDETQGAQPKKLPSFRDLEGINFSGDLDPTEYVRKRRED